MWAIPSNNVEGRVLMALVIAFLVLAWVSFTIRIYAKFITRVQLDASDYTCFASLLFSVGLTVIIWAVFSHGWGLDVSHFTVENQIFSGKLFVAILIIWNTAVTLVRVSMLLFYIRVFSVSKLKPVFWVTFSLNITICFAICVAALTICQPISYAYNPTPGGHCGNILALQTFTAYWNLLADVTVVVLPMPILWSLKITTQKKIGLSIVMGMGTVICVGTITRVIFSAVYMTDNITKQNAVVVFITGMEPIIGVINACLPHFPPVLRKLRSSHFATTLSQIFRTERSVNRTENKVSKRSSTGHYIEMQEHRDNSPGVEEDATELKSLCYIENRKGIKVQNDFFVEHSSA